MVSRMMKGDDAGRQKTLRWDHAMFLPFRIRAGSLVWVEPTISYWLAGSKNGKCGVLARVTWRPKTIRHIRFEMLPRKLQLRENSMFIGFYSSMSCVPPYFM
jgi:hypothetical protein